MLENLLTKYEYKLRKVKVGWGKSARSEARGVSRSEALNIIKLWRQTGALSLNKIDELHTRAQTLKKDLTPGTSPFNSPFYVVDLDPTRRMGICVEIRGRGKMREVLLAFADCLLREVYRAELSSNPVNQYRGLVMSENELVGDAFYVGRNLNLLIIRLKRLHKRISMKFKRTRLWTIGVEISCPLKEKQEILSVLERLHREYEYLRSTKLQHSNFGDNQKVRSDGGRKRSFKPERNI